MMDGIDLVRISVGCAMPRAAHVHVSIALFRAISHSSRFEDASMSLVFRSSGTRIPENAEGPRSTSVPIPPHLLSLNAFDGAKELRSEQSLTDHSPGHDIPVSVQSAISSNRECELDGAGGRLADWGC